MNRELQTGISKETWIGLKHFTGNVYYKPMYAPMFVVGDEVVVFDHYRDMLLVYDDAHNKVDSADIYYHRMKGKQSWDKTVIRDELNHRIYTVLVSGGYHILSEIDIETGELRSGHRLYFKYVEDIQVRGGEVFYIYRPFESIQKKFLYREKLTSS